MEFVKLLRASLIYSTVVTLLVIAGYRLFFEGFVAPTNQEIALHILAATAVYTLSTYFINLINSKL